MEVGLAVINGSRTYRVTQADVLKHVFGDALMIDISARDIRRARQWNFSTGQDTCAPFGPGITRKPRDIIAPGMPEGVGAGRSPQEWLWPGDVMVATVEGSGTIRHPVVNATSD